MERISAPATSLESLVEKWYNRVSAVQYAHYSSATYYSSRNRVLGIPAILLSTFAGATVFASLKTEQLDYWLQISVGLASIFSAVLASLQTFFGYTNLIERHRAAGAKYGILGRELEYMLADTSSIQSTAIADIQKRLGDLATESPNNPPFIYRKAVAALESVAPGKHPTI